MNPSFSKKVVGDITNLYQNIQEAPLRDEPLWDMEGDPKPTPTPVVKPSSVGAVTPTQAIAAASDLRNTGNVSQTNTAAARPNTGVTPLKPIGTQPTATQATAILNTFTSTLKGFISSVTLSLLSRLTVYCTNKGNILSKS